jgi:hypothetical protein
MAGTRNGVGIDRDVVPAWTCACVGMERRGFHVKKAQQAWASGCCGRIP